MNSEDIVVAIGVLSKVAKANSEESNAYKKMLWERCRSAIAVLSDVLEEVAAKEVEQH